MYHGIINVYKEQGYTSFDVVAKLRGICGQKKIGHTGTLDPDAEGVLLVCLGKATKVCDMLTDRDKEYQAVMLLGIETDTQDTGGQILKERSIDGITESQIRDVVSGFSGEQQQIPPMYSALKVNGQKLCDLARRGQNVERKARHITIYDIRIDEICLPRVKMTVKCSKGTYIRTLCHDIGQKLECGAALEHLLRTQAAGYRVEDACSLKEIQQMREQGILQKVIRPVEDVFSDYPAMQTLEAGDKMLYNGNKLYPNQLKRFFCRYAEREADLSDHAGQDAECVREQENGREKQSPVRIFDSRGVFCAVYQYYSIEGCYKPVKMFL